MNSFKHGLCAKKLALPNEDAALLQEKLQWWNDAYQLNTPGESELIAMAVTASVQRTRSQRYLTAALTEQVLNAEKRWDEAREDDVLRLVKLLVSEPDVAVAGLRRNGHGCRWLIARWQFLSDRLEAKEGPGDGWEKRDCLEAIRLQGKFVDPAHLNDSMEAETTRLCFQIVFPNNALGGYDGGPIDIRDVLKAQDWGQPKDAAPDPKKVARKAAAREWLTSTIARNLDELVAWEAIVRESFDAPSRALSKERALLLEGPTGSNWQRYERMHELAFHRAYHAFVKGREKEAETGVPPGLQNEANEAEEGDSTREEETAYVAAPAPQTASVATLGGEVSGMPRTFAGALARNEAKRPGRSPVMGLEDKANVDADEEVRGPILGAPESSGPIAGAEGGPPSVGR